MNCGNNNGPRNNNGSRNNRPEPFVFQGVPEDEGRPRRRQPVKVSLARRRAAELVRKSALRQITKDFRSFTQGRRGRGTQEPPLAERNRPAVAAAANRPDQRRRPLARSRQGVKSADRADFERFAKNKQKERTQQQSPETRRRKKSPARSAPTSVRRRSPLMRPRQGVKSTNRADYERFAQELRARLRNTEIPARQSVLRRSARLAAKRK